VKSDRSIATGLIFTIRVGCESICLVTLDFVEQMEKCTEHAETIDKHNSPLSQKSHNSIVVPSFPLSPWEYSRSPSVSEASQFNLK
jgi:hypothetical protein